MLGIDDSTLNKNLVPVLKELKILNEKRIHEQNIVKSWQPLSPVKEMGPRYDYSTKKAVSRSYHKDQG